MTNFNHINKCIIKIESNDKLKEINIKSRMCYYFNNTSKTEDFDLHNILIDKESYKNILVYNISYKRLIDYKPLSSRFNKIDGFIRVYDGLVYSSYDRISVTSGVTYIISHNYATIKVDSRKIQKKTITFCNDIILVSQFGIKIRIIITIIYC